MLTLEEHEKRIKELEAEGLIDASDPAWDFKEWDPSIFNKPAPSDPQVTAGAYQAVDDIYASVLDRPVEERKEYEYHVNNYMDQIAQGKSPQEAFNYVQKDVAASPEAIKTRGEIDRGEREEWHTPWGTNTLEESQAAADANKQLLIDQGSLSDFDFPTDPVDIKQHYDDLFLQNMPTDTFTGSGKFDETKWTAKNYNEDKAKELAELGEDYIVTDSRGRTWDDVGPELDRIAGLDAPRHEQHIDLAASQFDGFNIPDELKQSLIDQMNYNQEVPSGYVDSLGAHPQWSSGDTIQDWLSEEIKASDAWKDWKSLQPPELLDVGSDSPYVGGPDSENPYGDLELPDFLGGGPGGGSTGGGGGTTDFVSDPMGTGRFNTNTGKDDQSRWDEQIANTYNSQINDLMSAFGDMNRSNAELFRRFREDQAKKEYDAQQLRYSQAAYGEKAVNREVKGVKTQSELPGYSPNTQGAAGHFNRKGSRLYSPSPANKLKTGQLNIA